MADGAAVVTKEDTIIRPTKLSGRVDFETEVHGRKVKAGWTWFRGDTINFLPDKKRMQSYDAIQKYMLAGITPTEPFIDENTRITAFGSCFAENISNYLNNQHYNVLTKKDIKSYVVKFGEGMVHTYAIRQQFEWALDGAKVNAELWHDKSAKVHRADGKVRQNTRQLFLDTDVFILTFGLSEVWYSKETGDVFWRAVPANTYDPERHGFRVVSTEQNRNNIQATYDVIRRYRPDAKIIFTLSPVPLVATFRPTPCFIANSYSKATLRAAIDDVFRANAADPNFFYWPSYEIVTDFFPNAFRSDRRHPDVRILSHIMRLFEEFYCVPAPDRPRLSLVQTLAWALMGAGVLPSNVRSALRTGQRAVVRGIASEQREKGNTEYADFLDLAADHYDPKAKMQMKVEE